MSRLRNLFRPQRRTLADEMVALLTATPDVWGKCLSPHIHLH